MGNKPAITLKTGWWGYALAALIILVRAFRPGAVPMEEWSAVSWVAMLTPALFPWYVYLACWAIYGGGMALVWLLRVVICAGGAAWDWVTGKNIRRRS